MNDNGSAGVFGLTRTRFTSVRWGKFGLKIIHSISDVEKKAPETAKSSG